MILGLDVGGTQTDAVLIEGSHVVAETKIPTESDLLETLRRALKKTAADLDPHGLERMAFSTTIATNAVVQERLDPAGMIVSAGPGMDPRAFSVGPSYHLVPGFLDHQGIEVRPLDRQAVEDASSRIRRDGIGLLGVVGKFSVRNPCHELRIGEWLGPAFSHIAYGHRISGALNFPRRVATAYLNASLYRVHQRFQSALLRILEEEKLEAPRYLLKPDGGTVALERTGDSPAGMVQSGPAASIMGALALDGCEGSTVVLDIGGTTTDFSVVLDGVPLLDPHGIRIGPYQTLIRSLMTRSIGVGGDSEVRTDEKRRLKIGPQRKGPPMAFGGPCATPTDAMVALGLLEHGNKSRARDAMNAVGTPRGWDPLQTARNVLEHTAKIIADAVQAFVYELNSRPVYTIHEVLHEKRIEPSSAVLIGGPAPQLMEYVEKALGLPCRYPSHHAVANAIGAAVSRVTSEIVLQADTQRGTVVIPEADIQQEIDSRFDTDQAISLAKEVLTAQSLRSGAAPESLDISVLELQCFNMIRHFSRTGRNIRLKMSITPGLVPEWRKDLHP
mgnify:CR=1 FL=1